MVWKVESSFIHNLTHKVLKNSFHKKMIKIDLIINFYDIKSKIWHQKTLFFNTVLFRSWLKYLTSTAFNNYISTDWNYKQFCFEKNSICILCSRIPYKIKALSCLIQFSLKEETNNKFRWSFFEMKKLMVNLDKVYSLVEVSFKIQIKIAMP